MPGVVFAFVKIMINFKIAKFAKIPVNAIRRTRLLSSTALNAPRMSKFRVERAQVNTFSGVSDLPKVLRQRGRGFEPELQNTVTLDVGDR